MTVAIHTFTVVIAFTYLLTYLLHGAESFLRRFSASQEISEGSLPHSQVPATCPYPEPARSSPYPHIPLLEDPSEYYPPIYAYLSQVISFPQVSPPKPCQRLTSPPYALHAPPIWVITFRKSNKHSLERQAGAYRLSRKKKTPCTM